MEARVGEVQFGFGDFFDGFFEVSVTLCVVAYPNRVTRLRKTLPVLLQLRRSISGRRARLIARLGETEESQRFPTAGHLVLSGKCSTS